MESSTTSVKMEDALPVTQSAGIVDTSVSKDVKPTSTSTPTTASQSTSASTTQPVAVTVARHVARVPLHTRLPARVRREARKLTRTEEEMESDRLSLERRTEVISEGDVVMLRLPSDIIKVVTVPLPSEGKSQAGAGVSITSLGKYGSFRTEDLIGKPFDVTYEIVPKPSSGTVKDSNDLSKLALPVAGPSSAMQSNGDASEVEPAANPAPASKKDKKQAQKAGKFGWQPQIDVNSMTLRPMKRARMEELENTDATNDLIDDNPELAANQQMQLLTPEEIAELRAQGVSAEEIMRRQIERHQRFGLKTEFSKEKWRKRKEKKFSTAFTPIAPTVENMIEYYLARAPQSIMNLRVDTASQLLNSANIRPDGRYLVVDDTGGLIVGAMLDRMGGEGRILQLTDTDSPPGWPVMEQMNFKRTIVERVVRWLNWNEAEEDWTPTLGEEDAPEISKGKAAQKERRKKGQAAEANAKREELFAGNWDGLICVTSISPISILLRLTPYLQGSATIALYSPYPQVLAQALSFMRDRPEYHAASMTESWMRKYQVLPGRTHPMMSMSGTGGFLLSATKVIPGDEPLPPRKSKKRKGGDVPSDANSGASTPKLQGEDAERRMHVRADENTTESVVQSRATSESRPDDDTADSKQEAETSRQVENNVGDRAHKFTEDAEEEAMMDVNIS